MHTCARMYMYVFALWWRHNKSGDIFHSVLHGGGNSGNPVRATLPPVAPPVNNAGSPPALSAKLSQPTLPGKVAAPDATAPWHNFQQSLTTTHICSPTEQQEATSKMP